MPDDLRLALENLLTTLGDYDPDGLTEAVLTERITKDATTLLSLAPQEA